MIKYQASTIISQEEPKNQKLFDSSREAFSGLMKKVFEISKKVGHPWVKEVAGYALKNASWGYIEQQDPETIFIKELEKKLPVVFFANRVNLFAEAFQKGAFAFYSRSQENVFGPFVGLYDPQQYSILFQAVNFLHEVRHAMDHKMNLQYAELSESQREIPAFMIEALIMFAYGERRVLRLGERYAQKIAKRIENENGDSEKILSELASQYEDELDRIYGKALSELEAKLRMDRFIYVLANQIYHGKIKK